MFQAQNTQEVKVTKERKQNSDSLDEYEFIALAKNTVDGITRSGEERDSVPRRIPYDNNQVIIQSCRVPNKKNVESLFISWIVGIINFRLKS